MLSILRPFADLWVGRHARPDASAVAAAAGKRPAVVVTGASRGIGFAIARRFAAGGHIVVLVAREKEPLEEAAQSVRAASGAQAIGVALDVTDAQFPERLEGELTRHGLFLDGLVNNAGLGLAGRFEDAAPEALESMIALNITALTRLCRHALEPMLARGQGFILNVASLGAFVPGPYQAAYYASKSYVVSLTEAMAEEAAGRGVRIAVVAPGPVATGFHAAMGASGALYAKFLPHMTPETVARSACRGLVLGRRVIVPGLAGPILAYAVRVLPRPISRPLMAILLKPRARG